MFILSYVKIISQFYKYIIFLSFSSYIFSCSGTQVPLQTGVATEGGTVKMSQINIQNNYSQIVKRDGSATRLISNANSIIELQTLLGEINREASTALGLWEFQIRSFYERTEFTHSINSRVVNTVTPTRDELREIQKRCADALAKNNFSDLKAELFLLDGLASELVGKLGETRPLSKR